MPNSSLEKARVKQLVPRCSTLQHQPVPSGPLPQLALSGMSEAYCFIKKHGQVVFFHPPGEHRPLKHSRTPGRTSESDCVCNTDKLIAFCSWMKPGGHWIYCLHFSWLVLSCNTKWGLQKPTAREGPWKQLYQEREVSNLTPLKDSIALPGLLKKKKTPKKTPNNPGSI